MSALRCMVWWAWLIASSAPLAAQPVRITDDLGVTHVWTSAPVRIVSLLPSLTETVCALGGCARLVAVDRYSNHPVEVLTLPRVGSMEDAQIERIVTLRPDAVLAATSTRAIDRLRSLGLKVVAIDTQSHADVKRSLDRVASLLGGTADAALLWQRIQQQIDTAAARVPPGLRGQRVYFEVDASPHGAGVGSFMGETLQRLGLGNILPPELGPFPKLNPEFVVRAQPDLIIAVQRNLQDMAGRPGWSRLRALQARRTCGFDPVRYEVLIRPGPRLGEAAAVLADCFAALERQP